MTTEKPLYNWYAIRVKSRSEKRVYQDLIDAQIEAYLPLQKKLRIWSDRKKWVEMPLISGYVFVFIGKKEYEKVLKTFNVVGFVFFDGKAAIIRDEAIIQLKRMLGQHEMELEITAERLTPGQLVEIIAGPLMGITGELIEYQGKNKVALRIAPLGYTVLIEAPEKNLVPCES